MQLVSVLIVTLVAPFAGLVVETWGAVESEELVVPVDDDPEASPPEPFEPQKDTGSIQIIQENNRCLFFSTNCSIMKQWQLDH